MIEAPTSRQVNTLNRLRQMLILMRAIKKRPEDLHTTELETLVEIEKAVELIYRNQRSRCGYPPIEDPLKPLWKHQRLVDRPDNRIGL